MKTSKSSISYEDIYMIEKKLCHDWLAWSKLVSELIKDGDKIYYGTLPDFPFIAVYEARQTHKNITFVTMKDFEVKKL